MHMEVASGLLDRAKDVFFHLRVMIAVQAPAESRPAVRARTEQPRSAQTDANVVSPAETWSQLQDLLFTAAVTVQENQQGVRVVRLVAGRQKGPEGPALGGLNLRG